MTLEECYAAVGGDYEGVLHRFMSPDRVRRFVLKLPADPNFNLLEEAIKAQDFSTAFRAAHSLKGIGLNLGFTALADSSSKLSDALRSGTPDEGYEALYEKVREDYRQTMDALQCLDS